MNLFVAGWSAGAAVPSERAQAALQSLAHRLPFFPGRPVASWRAPSGAAAVTWLTHAPEQIGGVGYVAAREHALALFAGRPIRWTPGGADGRSPLDPATYLEPLEAWADELDGRAVVLRYDDSERALDVWTDPLGAYPVFEAVAGETTWLSNSAALLRDLAGTGEPDHLALAGLLGGGWSLTGDPVWRGVRRLPRGARRRLAASAGPGGEAALPDAAIAALPGAGLDVAAAAATLVASVRALADWPGRPSVVPVTAGRDSRLVLAAALAGGLSFEAATGGAPDSPDVLTGRRLCELVGVPHRLLPADPHGDVWSDPERAAELVRLTAGGTASLADAAGFPMGPWPGPLALWHSGQGGEVARQYYGVAASADVAALAEFLYRAFTGRRPGRLEPLSEMGRDLVLGHLREWVARQLAAGARPADVPDLFYLHKRMGTWAGATHGCVEFVRDTTSPLWSARLLPHQLGLAAGERAREHFHLRVLRELAPELVDVPFEGGQTWPGHRSGARQRLERLQRLGMKAAGELRRRVAVRGGLNAARAHPDPFAGVQELVARRAVAEPDHPAWSVLDRARVERLLSRRPEALDTMSRYYVWRLATVLLARDA